MYKRFEYLVLSALLILLYKSVGLSYHSKAEKLIHEIRKEIE